jgi:rfaE bifunctional protein nucleotidyltransferase chain/domain
MNSYNKYLNTNQLKKKLIFLKKNKKKIVLCHGVFDLVHLGHIKYFKSAKSYGDYLIVSVTVDRFVNKGPGRPIFNQGQRLEFLNELEAVDNVIFSHAESAKEVIKLIKPDFYIKGPDYRNNKLDKTKKIILEKKTVESFGGKIIYTNDLVFSSSKIINSNNLNLDEIQRVFINDLKKKFTYDKIIKEIYKFRNLSALVIGELIIDKYCFGDIIGKSGKEPHLVLKEKFIEDYIGGSGAIARHISSFVKIVNIISPFGFESRLNNFLKRSFTNNIKTFFIKPYKDFITITKTRFIDAVSNYKVFGSYKLPEKFYLKSEKVLNKIINKNIKKADLIIIADYGHNFISQNVANKLIKSKKFISLNAQINSSNIGFHSIDKYYNIDSVIINETELRYELRDNIADIVVLATRILKLKKIKNIIVTRGKYGAILVSVKNNKYTTYTCPAFALKTVDKVGSGDAMLAICSLALKQKLDPHLVLFLGSLSASILVEAIGNKEHVNFEKLERMVEYILK